MTLTFEPLISLPLWLTLAAATAGLLFWYGWRRPWGLSQLRWFGIVGMMSLCAVMLLTILLNPTWHEQIPPPRGKPKLSILIDVSASMASKDMPDGQSRFQVARKLAQQCEKELGRRFKTQTLTFAGAVLAADASHLDEVVPNGRTTDLAVAIAAGIESNRNAGQAVLLLSDGNHNAPGGTNQVLASVSLARAANAPIFTKTLGSDAEVHDLSLRIQSPQQLAFIRQNLAVSGFVRRRGRAPQAVAVVLELNGKEVERQQVFLASDAETEVRFQVEQAKKGLYRYEMRVDPFENELIEVNNYGTVLLRVVDEPIRVLLVEGKPYWDSKFLMRMLASDRSIEPVSLVRMADNRFLERVLKRKRDQEGSKSESDEPVIESWRVLSSGAELLGDATKLGQFQVIILGRDSEIFFDGRILENLRNWVATDSGSLVCSRGQPMVQVNERLDRMLPIHWNSANESRFRVELTDRGRDLRWFDSEQQSASSEKLPHLPTLATSSAVSSPRPLATVLASVAGEADGKVTPVVTYQHYGGGRVVVVEGTGMWRWAFLPPAYAELDSTYSSLWQSLLRWLVSGAGLLPGEDMALRTDQVTFGTNEPATATILVRRDVEQKQVPNVELSGGTLDQVQTHVPVAAGEGLGTYRIVFGELPEGRYRARLSGQPENKSGTSTEFDVRRYMGEELDMAARPDLMARIASETGGIDLKEGAAIEIKDAFNAHLNRGRTEQVVRTTAWDRWWIMLGCLATWAAAWGLRRNAGLV